MNKNKQEKSEEKEVEKKPIAPVDQWLGLSHQLHLHKKVNFILGSVCGLQIMLITLLAFQDPIVAVINEGQRVMLKASRKHIPVGEKEIKRVVKEYIKRRYQWDELEPSMISKNIEPLVTGGFKKKTQNFLTDLRDNGLQKKKASQKITDINVTVTEKSIFAHFDKVLRLEGIPLIIPTGISLAVVKGARTFWNPEGIYINGILENASK